MGNSDLKFLNPKRNTKKKTDYLSVYISSKINAIRLDRGLTQEDLADIVGMSRVSLVNQENGRQGIPIKRLFDLAVALDVEISELIPTTEWYKKNKDKQVRRIVTFEVIDPEE